MLGETCLAPLAARRFGGLWDWVEGVEQFEGTGRGAGEKAAGHLVEHVLGAGLPEQLLHLREPLGQVGPHIAHQPLRFRGRQSPKGAAALQHLQACAGAAQLGYPLEQILPPPHAGLLPRTHWNKAVRNLLALPTSELLPDGSCGEAVHDADQLLYQRVPHTFGGWGHQPLCKHPHLLRVEICALAALPEKVVQPVPPKLAPPEHQTLKAGAQLRGRIC
mmetsp:Transcript_10404/g.29629  ORF Transcript_10404/g.29629 Transcript_10404/m.29629 type:complete len:219 (-) Transcript_10404:1915-2571(-)